MNIIYEHGIPRCAQSNMTISCNLPHASIKEPIIKLLNGRCEKYLKVGQPEKSSVAEGLLESIKHRFQFLYLLTTFVVNSGTSIVINFGCAHIHGTFSTELLHYGSVYRSVSLNNYKLDRFAE